MITNLWYAFLGKYYAWKNRLKTGSYLPAIRNWSLPKDMCYYEQPIRYERRSEYDVEADAQSGKSIIAHTFWDGELNEKCLFSIKSFLCTQQSYTYEIWLWMNGQHWYEKAVEHVGLQKLCKYFPCVKIKKWDFDKEIQGTPYTSISWYFKICKPLPAVADDFRLVALYKWGGCILI